MTGIVRAKRSTWLRLLSAHVEVTVPSAWPGSCFRTSGLARCHRQARRGHTRHISRHAEQAERAKQADKVGEAGEASETGKGKHGKQGRQKEQGKQTNVAGTVMVGATSSILGRHETTTSIDHANDNKNENGNTIIDMGQTKAFVVVGCNMYLDVTA